MPSTSEALLEVALWFERYDPNTEFPLVSEIFDIRRRFLSGTGSRIGSADRPPPLLRLHSAVKPAELPRLLSIFGEVLRLRDENGDGSGLNPSGRAGTGGTSSSLWRCLSSGLTSTIWSLLIRLSFQYVLFWREPPAILLLLDLILDLILLRLYENGSSPRGRVAESCRARWPFRGWN